MNSKRMFYPNKLPSLNVSRRKNLTAKKLCEIFEKQLECAIEDLLKTRLLHVEDERDYRTSLNRLLIPFFSLSHAKNGKQAKSIIKKSRPFDHILLDIALPDTRGDKLYMKIRELEGQKASSVIAVTGHMNVEEARQLLDYGLFTIVDKPFKTKELIKKIAAGRRVILVPQTVTFLDFYDWPLEERYNYFNESYPSGKGINLHLADLLAFFPEFYSIVKERHRVKKIHEQQ